MTTLITMRHVRQAHMCSRGVRAFFVRHDLDWVTFIKEGLPEDVVLSTGDAMAIKVVEVARGQRG
jgi:hypothetical protein